MLIMQRRNEKTEDGVSPVVGVMLMLVVTIIIAAVVTGFASGMIGSAEKSPSLTMDISIKNTGSYATSVFEAKVLSVSEPIATKNLRLITSWSTTDKSDVDRNVISGGSIVTATPNVNWEVGFNSQTPYNMTAPWGYGNGVQEANTGKPNSKTQQFGNYSLLGGTVMSAIPAGQAGGFVLGASGTDGYGITTKYTYDGIYTSGSDKFDGMQAVLGKGWESLRAGDSVNVKLVYIPSGATIFEKTVVVG